MNGSWVHEAHISSTLNKSSAIQCSENRDTSDGVILTYIQDCYTYWYYVCFLLTWPDSLLVWRWLECICWWNKCCCSLSWHTWGTLSQRVRHYTVYIAGNFRGRKLPRISRFCGYSRKFSPRNLGAWHPLAWHKQAISESFLRENILRKFFPSKVSRYCMIASYPGLTQLSVACNTVKQYCT